VRTQALVAAGCAALVSIVTVRFLVNYFKTRTLTPFGLYCLAFGAAMAVYTTVH
jgi:undecaprenyl-diphosphatase